MTKEGTVHMEDLTMCTQDSMLALFTRDGTRAMSQAYLWPGQGKGLGGGQRHSGRPLWGPSHVLGERGKSALLAYHCWWLLALPGAGASLGHIHQ